jgi:ubiquinone/menaquinone biosynthesis C-methylase UbiE
MEIAAPIAIVVPILNEARALPELLAGIARQTLCPAELIFVDAGSRDGSVDLIHAWWKAVQWPDCKCEIVLNSGGLPGANRNAGIRHAGQPWIAFLDAGIVPHPDWLEQLFNFANIRKSRAVFGLCEFEATSVTTLAICALSYGQGAARPVLPASMFRRENFDETGWFREDLRATEDILWMQQLYRVSREKPVCEAARVRYNHFPPNLPAAFRKWRRNEAVAVHARVRSGQHLLYAFGLPLLVCLPFYNLAAGFSLIALYLVGRGIVDPMRRAENWQWWTPAPPAALLAIPVAFILDFAKWLGVVDGLLEKSGLRVRAHSGAASSISNVDSAVADGFADEWNRFPQDKLPQQEQQENFQSYFAIFPWDTLPSGSVGADIGCGSGRWAALVAPRVGRLQVVDVSVAVLDVARRNLAHVSNVDFHQASVGRLPFADASLDFAYCLGVLHHVPDHELALHEIARVLKPGAPFLVYLYYAFDNRPRWFRLTWRIAEGLRRVISRMPFGMRAAVCQVLAVTVYWPMARVAQLLFRLGRLPAAWPLAFYRDKSLYTMRTDALDRFGTRLEKRFSRVEILTMLERCGFGEVRFSETVPFWCALATRSGNGAGAKAA